MEAAAQGARAQWVKDSLQNPFWPQAPPSPRQNELLPALGPALGLSP